MLCLVLGQAFPFQKCFILHGYRLRHTSCKFDFFPMVNLCWLYCYCCLLSLHLEVICADPGVPLNGARRGNDLSFGGELTFSCDIGYNLLGSASRVCQADGTFSGVEATCTGKKHCLQTTLLPNSALCYINTANLSWNFACKRSIK